MRNPLLATVLLLSLTGQLFAGPAECTCQNLSDLQGEYKNAAYLEKFELALAEHLKKSEDELRALHASEDEIGEISSDVRVAYINQNFKMPVATPWYHGPDSVKMTLGTCEQPQPDLDAMEAGSPCEAIADMALAHELGHRDICNAMGADVYWSRPSSEIALEEADRYKIQAANLKSELRRVLDVSLVELKGTWRHTLDAQGQMVVTYFYETQSGDIGDASGGDTWTMAGKGETSNSIEKVSIAGMACRGQGAVRTEFDVAMTTDGLTFGLEMTGRSVAGDLGILCPRGMGMALPTSDSGSGVLTTGQTLYSGDNLLPAPWADVIKAMIAAGGVMITGDPEMVLSVSCPAP